MNRNITGSVLAFALAALVACAGQGSDRPLDFPVDADEGGKTDVFGRRLAGVASDYEASDLDEESLAADMRRRRAVAWSTIGKILEPVPLLGLADSAKEHEEIALPDGQVPKIPRFQTWYGVDEIKRMFQHLYGQLGADGRAVRAPFTQAMLDETVGWNALALDRSKRWPLERYFRYVKDLGVCPEDMPADECADLVQERSAGATNGNARILYSPATLEHVLRNYGSVLDCMDPLDELGLDAQPASEANFTLCFGDEFPNNGVLIKAQWARADIGKPVPVYDTDGDALAARLAGSAHWGAEGDRQADPPPSKMFTIRLRSGDVYRLVGLHIMTKELRHWQWITMWWSDKPDTDFGADRPEALRTRLDQVWSNYKMCVVDQHEEKDANAAARFEDSPSLAAAIRAIDNGAGGPTWCSNPYLEHGRNNARTNCIGCHQHGGSTVVRDVDSDGTLDPLDLKAIIGDEIHFPSTGREQIRKVFPADYLYSFNRVDDFAAIISAEVGFVDNADYDAVRARVEQVLTLERDASAGHTTFLVNCSTCHGETGEGSGWAPNLYTRVPTRTGESIVQTLLQGRGGMPRWGDLLGDQELADLLGHLRATFGGGD